MEKAFRILKSAFIFTPILCLFNPFRKIVIEINASDYALGVIFS